MPETCKVSVDIGSKTLGVVRTENQSFVSSAKEVAAKVFDSSLVHLVGVGDKPSTLVNGERDVGSCVLSKEVELAYD